MFKQTNPLYIFISSYANNNNNTRELNKKKNTQSTPSKRTEGGGR